MNKYCLTAAFAAISFGVSFAAQPQNPYGVCAHVSRGEFVSAPEEMKIMRDAGIGIYRTDFDWVAVERERGKLDFARWEKLCEYGAAAQLEVLAIIPGGAPKFANPFPQNADLLAEFAAKAASHFKGKIKYWEIVNEPNIKSFWGGCEPDAALYGKLIQKVYPAIKSANPDAVVLYAGMAGVPLDFIETSFKAGAVNSFDIMNVHPYNWQDVQEGSLIPKINALRGLMKRYGVGDKPIWITEFGYTTSQLNPSIRKYIARALEILKIDEKKITIAYVRDEKYGYIDEFTGEHSLMFPEAKKFKAVSFDKLEGLSVEDYPVLYIPANESFSYAHIGHLVDYVARGGTIVSPGGLPFYYDISIGENGEPVRRAKGREMMKHLHLASRTSNDKDVPFVKPMLKQTSPYIGTVVQKESGKGFEDIEPKGNYLPFFASDANLAAGDEMHPIVSGVFGDKKLPLAALYTFNSDLKGNAVIFFTPMEPVLSEDVQGKMLPRQYLLARSAGVERVFKYCLKSSERDYARESHFGMLHNDLSPKPSYIAYATLAKMLGTAVPEVSSSDGVYTASWKRDDGEFVSAVWTIMGERRITLKVDGEVKETVNHLGKAVSVVSNDDGSIRVKAGGGVIYIVGAKSIKVLK